MSDAISSNERCCRYCELALKPTEQHWRGEGTVSHLDTKACIEAQRAEIERLKGLHADALCAEDNTQKHFDEYRRAHETKCDCRSPGEMYDRDCPVHGQNDDVIPHGVIFDKLGWCCSVCGGWNHARDTLCTHTHSVVKSEAPRSAFVSQDRFENDDGSNQ